MEAKTPLQHIEDITRELELDFFGKWKYYDFTLIKAKTVLTELSKRIQNSTPITLVRDTRNEKHLQFHCIEIEIKINLDFLIGKNTIGKEYVADPCHTLSLLFRLMAGQEFLTLLMVVRFHQEKPIYENNLYNNIRIRKRLSKTIYRKVFWWITPCFGSMNASPP